MTVNTATYQIEDHSIEKTSLTINIGGITAINYTAKHAAIDALGDALVVILAGKLRQTSVNERFVQDTDAVTDANAQRERKWLITYLDTQAELAVGVGNAGYGNYYNNEVGAVDTSDGTDSYVIAGTDLIDLTHPDVVDFITAFEAIAQSPTGGAQNSVRKITMVGRNL